MNGSFKADFLIVGAGFAGATFARLAADNGYSVHVIDRRRHIGGNSYSYKDTDTGIEVHKYGPHIFHTNSKEIWDFISRFSEFNNYVNRVKAVFSGRVYSLPINLHTINQFFNKSLSPVQAKEFIGSLRVPHAKITNFQEYIESSLGQELYEAFFKYYTLKQWGVDPTEINVSTAKRLPIRFNYDDNYYNDAYQGIPVDGYTIIFERMLNHEKISIFLNSDYEEFKDHWRSNYRWLVYTGSIDEYFSYCYGKLPYRALRFEEIRDNEIQGNAVVNYTDLSVQFTRIHEHKWFTPEKSFDKSIAFKEYSYLSDDKNTQYYPIRNTKSEHLLGQYEKLKKEESDVVFVGRLAEFRYYDMHQVMASSKNKFEKLMRNKNGTS